MAGGSVSIGISANVQSAVDSLTKLAAQSDITEQESRRLASGLNAQADALEKTARAADPAYAALVKLNDAQARANLLVETGKISADQAEAAVGRLRVAYEQAADRASKAAAGAESMGHANAGAAREFVVLGHEVISGNFSRIPGSLMVLAERSGNLSGILRTITSPAGIATGALLAMGTAAIALAVHEEEAQRETNSLATAFSAMSKGAGVTGGDIRNMVNQVAQLHGVNHESAVEIIADLARTRDLGGAAFADLTTNAARYAAIMGTTAPEATKELAKAFSGSADEIRKLDEQYNFLSAAQTEQIRQAELVGDRMKAGGIAMAAWSEYAKKVQVDTTKTQDAADDLRKAWDAMMHSMGDTSVVTGLTIAWDGLIKMLTGVVKFVTPINDVDRAQKTLHDSTAQYDKLLAASHGAAGYERQLATLKQQIEDAQRIIDKANSQQNAPQHSLATANGVGQQDNSQEQIKAMTTALSAYAGQQARVHDLDIQIAAAKQVAATATGADADRLKLLIVDAQKYRDEIAKVAEVPSRLPQWQTEMAQMDAAADKSRLQQLSDDAEYWRQILQRADLSAKERQQVEKQLADAEIQINRGVLAAAAQYDREDQQIKQNRAKADLDIIKMNEEAEMASLDATTSKTVAASQRKFDSEEGLVRSLAALQIERIRIEQQGLESGTVEYEKYADEIRKTEAKLDLDLAQLRARAMQEQLQITQAETKQWKTIWDGATRPVGQAFDTFVSNVVKGSSSMSQAFAKAGTQMAVGYIEDIVKMTARFIAYVALNQLGWTEMATSAIGSNNVQLANSIAAWAGITTAQTTATTAGTVDAKAAAISQIPAYTGIAAMGAASAVASTPFVGPALAASSAATMEGLGSAELAKASAFGGFAQVPYDGLNTELHKDEMVLPAYLATPLRSMVGASGSFGGGTGAGSSGTTSSSGTTIHFNISAIDSGSVAKFFQTNGSHIASAITTQLRLSNNNLGDAIRRAA